MQYIDVGCSSFNSSLEAAIFHVTRLELHSNKLFLSDIYIYRVSVTH